MAMRGFGSRLLRMSSRHDHMKNALISALTDVPGSSYHDSFDIVDKPFSYTRLNSNGC